MRKKTLPILVLVLLTGFASSLGEFVKVGSRAIASSTDKGTSLISNLQASTDGKRIFFNVAYADSIQEELWMLEIESGRSSMVLDDVSALFSHVSPDGMRVVYSEPDPERHGSWQIKLMTLEERCPRLLAREPIGTIPSWSPDGRRIAFVTASSQDDPCCQLRVVDADGVLPDLISEHVLSGKFSWGWHVSGSKIVLSSGKGTEACIVVWDLEDMREEVVVKGHSIGNLAFLTMTFSPDGKEMFFTEYTDVGLEHGIARPWRCSIDGTNLRRPRMPEGDYYAARWSPDGARIAGRYNEVPSGDTERKYFVFVWDKALDITKILSGGMATELSWLPNGDLLCTDTKRIFILSDTGEGWKEGRELYNLSNTTSAVK